MHLHETRQELPRTASAQARPYEHIRDNTIEKLDEMCENAQKVCTKGPVDHSTMCLITATCSRTCTYTRHARATSHDLGTSTDIRTQVRNVSSNRTKLYAHTGLHDHSILCLIVATCVGDHAPTRARWRATSHSLGTSTNIRTHKQTRESDFEAQKRMHTRGPTTIAQCLIPATCVQDHAPTRDNCKSYLARPRHKHGHTHTKMKPCCTRGTMNQNCMHTRGPTKATCA